MMPELTPESLQKAIENMKVNADSLIYSTSFTYTGTYTDTNLQHTVAAGSIAPINSSGVKICDFCLKAEPEENITTVYAPMSIKNHCKYNISCIAKAQAEQAIVPF